MELRSTVGVDSSGGMRSTVAGVDTLTAEGFDDVRLTVASTDL